MSEPSTFKFLSRELLAQGDWIIGSGGTVTVDGNFIVTGTSSFEGNVGMFGVFVFPDNATRDAAAASLNVARLDTNNIFSPLRTNAFGTVSAVNLGVVNAELGTNGDPTRVYGHIACSTTMAVGGVATFSAAISVAGTFTHTGAAVAITNSQAWRTALGVPGLTGDNTLNGNLSVVGNLTVGGIFSHTATAANVVSLANPQAWRTAMAVPGLATDNSFTALTNTFQNQLAVLGNTFLGNASSNQIILKGVLTHNLGTLTLDASTLTAWKTTLGIAGTGGIGEQLAGKANLAGGNSFTAGDQTFYPAVDGPNTLQVMLSSGSHSLSIGSVTGASFFSGLWMGPAAPATTNYSLISDGVMTVLNAPTSSIALRVAGVNKVTLSSNTLTVSVAATLNSTLSVSGTVMFTSSFSVTGPSTLGAVTAGSLSAGPSTLGGGTTVSGTFIHNTQDAISVTLNPNAKISWQAALGIAGTGGIGEQLAGKANLVGGNSFTGAQLISPAVDGPNTLQVMLSSGSRSLSIGTLPGTPTFSGLWAGPAIPTANNYVVISDGTYTHINAPSPSGSIFMKVGGTSGGKVTLSSTVFSVSLPTIIDSNLTVSAAATLNSTLSVSGMVMFTSSFSVTGPSTLGAVTAGSLSAGGVFTHSATAANAVVISNPLTWRTALEVPGLGTDNIFTGQMSLTGQTAAAGTSAMTRDLVDVRCARLTSLATNSGSSVAVATGDVGLMTELTNTGAITVTIGSGTSSIPTNSECVYRRAVAAGALTLTASGGMTIDNAADALYIPPGGTFVLKKLSSTRWILI